MRKSISIFLFLLLVISCHLINKDKVYSFDYDYEIKSYYTNTSNPENLRYIEYYKDEKLIRKIGRDGDCTTILYYENGKIKEIRWGRN